MTTLLDLTDRALPSGKVKVPAPPAAKAHSPILVNGVEISGEAVRTEAQNHPSSTPAEALAAAARALVVRELLLQEASTLAVVADPQVVAEGKRETDEDSAIRILLDQEISTPRADTQACRRYFDANMQKFRSGALYETRHILCAAPLADAGKRDQAKRDAQAIIDVLGDAPERFAELALDRSACPSKMQGGSLGKLTRGSTVPEFETVLFALAEGQLSPVPVPTQFGFHVIKLDRIIEGRQLPFELVEGRIAAWLEASSWSRGVAQYVGILAGKADIRGIDISATVGPLVQ